MIETASAGKIEAQNALPVILPVHVQNAYASILDVKKSQAKAVNAQHAGRMALSRQQ